ncbi:MAG: hypothetical protein HOP97_09570 [Terrabacter sp.]|nr:hypothetical protein [Dermatophilaceae bacterium]NUO89793.1 hypothetical protein [Dermatophilaceae bacterium]NUR15789.1 hypothetical protein [Dermatophilaceae bacterium]NUR81857.1 hypothetical protein [Dermatophilaceae bacterium]NUS41860.1 hypothetical protein [Terrabacter sp.]
MDQQVMNRRRVLAGAGAAGAVAVGSVAGASSASASDGGPRPSGSWVINRKDDPPSTDMAKTVVSFAAGRVIVVHDIAPAGPPGTGTWASSGDGGFKATFWFGQPGPGGPGSPGVTIRVRVRGKARRYTISGTYRFSVFDPSGAVVQSGTGSFSGHPIEA